MNCCFFFLFFLVLLRFLLSVRVFSLLVKLRQRVVVLAVVLFVRVQKVVDMAVLVLAQRVRVLVARVSVQQDVRDGAAVHRAELEEVPDVVAGQARDLERLERGQQNVVRLRLCLRLFSGVLGLGGGSRVRLCRWFTVGGKGAGAAVARVRVCERERVKELVLHAPKVDLEVGELRDGLEEREPGLGRAVERGDAEVAQLGDARDAVVDEGAHERGKVRVVLLRELELERAQRGDGHVAHDEAEHVRVEVVDGELREAREGDRVGGPLDVLARAAVVQGEALEIGGGAEDGLPLVAGGACGLGVELELEGAEAGEVGRRVEGPGEVDADEGEVLYGGRVAAEDGDGGPGGLGGEVLEGVPFLEVPELHALEVGDGAGRVEAVAGAGLADEVGDLEDEGAPAGGVGVDDVEGGVELRAGEGVAGDVVGEGDGVDEDVEGAGAGAEDELLAALEVDGLAHADAGPEGGRLEGDGAPVVADVGDEDLEVGVVLAGAALEGAIGIDDVLVAETEDAGEELNGKDVDEGGAGGLWEEEEEGEAHDA